MWTMVYLIYSLLWFLKHFVLILFYFPLIYYKISSYIIDWIKIYIYILDYNFLKVATHSITNKLHLSSQV